MPTRLRLAMLAASLGLLFAAAPSTADTVPGTTAAAAIRYDYEQDIFHPVYARNGMVATEQALATQVGLDILRRGGNAVDAAVAVGFALAVVLPNAGNIGGGGFLMLHDARTGQDIALDFREMAPERAGRDMYLDAEGKVVEGRSLYTHLAVGVPGTVAGMEHALRRWGTMRLRDVIAPAIRLAEQGFTVSPTLAKVLEVEKDNLGKWPATRAIFFRGERPLKAGERWYRKTWPVRCG